MFLISSDADIADRIFDHIDGKSTDLGDEVWREPVESYRSTARFDAEINILRRLPIPFCPSAALPENRSYVARTAALTPLLAVRGDDGVVRAFRNSCRHRGMALAQDSGCVHAFVCPYHAWTYGLDGRLLHIPGEGGFPDLDWEQHGLVPVKAEERSGLVFITQDDPISEGTLAALPDFFTRANTLFDKGELSDNANWKLIAETSMEGYHIKALHTDTFYPYGFDNLNVVETYGPNSRIVFPFRRIEKLRDVPREERCLDGMVTDVYQLFPNTHIAYLSNHALLIILEPETPTRSRWVIYRMSHNVDTDNEQELAKAKRDAEFVQDSGLIEDRQAACAIQLGLQSNSNSHFTFGRFEKAAVHFHTHMHDLLLKLQQGA
jgi:choline monooxygenase